MDILDIFFGNEAFMPHGHCYLWEPALLWTEVIANSLIGLAYFVIAGALTVLIRKLEALPFRWMYHLFALFIFACGVTHIFDVVVIWVPTYWLDASIRVVTAIVSVLTAILLPPLIPQAVSVFRGAHAAMEKGIRLETAVEDLESMYEQTKELEEQKSRFFANVSHELRTPLAIVQGRAEQLLSKTRDSDEKEALEVIRTNTAILKKHVEDLLDIASYESGQLEVDFQTCDLSQITRRITGTFEGLADEYNIDYSVQVPETCTAYIDRSKYESILINLLSNALKFTPDGGTVECEVTVTARSDQTDHFTLTVADSGPGIPPEKRDEIFERFKQIGGESDSRFKGTGLGLVMVKNAVEILGGQIEVSDSIHGGAKFEVSMPVGRRPDSDGDPEPDTYSGEGQKESARAKQAAKLVEAGRDQSDIEQPSSVVEPPSDLPSAPRPPTQDDITILVVEDHRQMNAYLRDLLNSDYSIHSAFTGEQALEQLGELDIDLVITDLMMPGMSGVELVEKIESTFRAEIPVLVLTAKASDETRREAIRKGAADFVPKPFSAEELRLRVGNLASVQRARKVLQSELEISQRDVAELANRLARKQKSQKSLLESTRMARREAEQSSRAKTQFLSLISHELRTPLASLQMQMELLERRIDEPAERRKDLHTRIRKSVEQLADLVEELLTRAEYSTGQISTSDSEFSIADLVDSVVSTVESKAAKKGLEIEVECPTELSPVYSDRRLLRIAVNNLLTNAIKFTDEGTISISVTQKNRQTRIAVQDTGRGIPTEDQNQIFEAFEKSPPSSSDTPPGLGLGLSIAKKIVGILDGTIDLHSRPEEGSNFIINIPNSRTNRDPDRVASQSQ